MSLKKAQELIAGLNRLKNEKEISETQFLGALDDILRQKENIKDYESGWLHYVYSTKDVIHEYKSKNLRVKYYYDDKEYRLCYYLIN